MKLLIFVLSVKDNGLYSAYYNAQRATWDNLIVPDVQTMYYFGKGAAREHSNEIHTDAHEARYNVGMKFIKALEQIKELDYDFMFRTNSCSYVDKQLLHDHLSTIKDDKYYSGIMGDCNGYKYGSGCGFIMTKKLADILVEQKDKFRYDWVDDIAVGERLANNGATIVTSKRFDFEQHRGEQIPKDYFHYRLRHLDPHRAPEVQYMREIFDVKYNNKQVIIK